MKSETQALVDRANQLRGVVLEISAAEKRYWDTYTKLADATREAANPEDLWAANCALRKHHDTKAPYSSPSIADWHRAIRAALDALGADAGVEREAIE